MSKHLRKSILKNTRKGYLKCLYMLLTVLLVMLGIFCTMFSRTYINRLIDSLMELKPDSEMVKMWTRPDINITYDFYFFNWTNSDDFYNMSIRPKVEEIGPYTFVEVPHKKIYQWHEENNTVEYAKTHYYYFDETTSKGTMDDRLVSVNSLLVAAAAKTKYWNFMKRTVVDMALRVYKNGIAWKKTADEFFFKGFNDDLVNLLAVFPSSLRSQMNLFLPWDRIGYAYARNGSADYLGKHSIYTGAGGMHNFGELAEWKGLNYTKAFPAGCSAVNGSPGEFQKTNLRKYDSIKYFATDFCRAVYLDYVDEVVVEGVIGYRYMISPKTWDNGTIYPGNECYCNGACLPYGVMNISSCWFGLPVFVSNPHFLGADSFFQDVVDGMKPNASSHTTYMTLEPRTGLAIEIKGRLQMNAYVEPVSHIQSYRNKKTIMFPITWFDMHMKISTKSALLLRTVSNLHLYCHIFGAIVILVASIIFLWRPLKRFCSRHYVHHHMQINTMDDDGYLESDTKDIATKDISLLFPSLLNMASHPRRSLPIIIASHDKGDHECLSSFLVSADPIPSVDYDEE